MLQTKEQDIAPGKEINEIQISQLPDNEFEVMVIKMLIELGEEWVNSVRTSTNRKI